MSRYKRKPACAEPYYAVQCEDDLATRKSLHVMAHSAVSFAGLPPLFSLAPDFSFLRVVGRSLPSFHAFIPVPRAARRCSHARALACFLLGFPFLHRSLASSPREREDHLPRRRAPCAAALPCAKLRGACRVSDMEGGAEGAPLAPLRNEPPATPSFFAVPPRGPVLLLSSGSVLCSGALPSSQFTTVARFGMNRL